MGAIGIIANPAAGKDVRRIAAHGFSVDNEQKTNIVRRLILGAVALGCRRVLLMPDGYGIAGRALAGLARRDDVTGCCTVLDMPMRHEAADTLAAAATMRREGVGCVVTLGGDGTARLAAKATGETPLLPISTGTNNVLPRFTEGTVAGMAAALVALHPPLAARCVLPRSGLVVRLSDGTEDLALVDAAALRGVAVGARAVWDWRALAAVAAVEPRPDAVGLSAIVGARHPEGPAAAWVRLGEGARVVAAIAPGTVAAVPIAESGLLRPGDVVSLGEGPLVVALDGERELVARRGPVTVTLAPDRARIVDAAATLAEAARLGLLTLT